jgi:hypothetical protein
VQNLSFGLGLVGIAAGSTAVAEQVSTATKISFAAKLEAGTGVN